jgi:Na+-driven multidrug efflux pump
MTEPGPNPPDEQPRVFTVIDLFWELVSTTVVCGGFYIGYSQKGFWAGLIGGVVARAVLVVVMMTLHDWVSRRGKS